MQRDSSSNSSISRSRNSSEELSTQSYLLRFASPSSRRKQSNFINSLASGPSKRTGRPGKCSDSSDSFRSSETDTVVLRSCKETRSAGFSSRSERRSRTRHSFNPSSDSTEKEVGRRKRKSLEVYSQPNSTEVSTRGRKSARHDASSLSGKVSADQDKRTCSGSFKKNQDDDTTLCEKISSKTILRSKKRRNVESSKTNYTSTSDSDSDSNDESESEHSKRQTRRRTIKRDNSTPTTEANLDGAEREYSNDFKNMSRTCCIICLKGTMSIF